MFLFHVVVFVLQPPDVIIEPSILQIFICNIKLTLTLSTFLLQLDAAEWTGPLNLNHVADTIQKERGSSMNDFQILHDGSSNTWHVEGAGLRRFVQMTNWQYVFFLTHYYLRV